MKKWNTPAIQELNLSNTAFGTAENTRPDWSFKDQDGHIFYSYSGVGPDVENREDRVPVNP